MSDQSLTRDEAIKYYGTEAATGWGKAAADQNFKSASTGSSSSSGGGFDFSVPTFDPNSIPVSQPTLTPSTINIDDYINAIRDTLPAPPEEYMKANPFYFDEQAARDVSTAEFAPYYNELLQDYLGEVKRTSDKYRGDATRILMDLDSQKRTFMDSNGKEFQQAIRGIKEGYSGKGLYFSGENQRTQKETTDANTNKLEGYLNTYGSKKGQTQADDAYQQEQLRIAAEQKARDIAREQEASIAGGINTQKDEAIDEWIYAMQIYYSNPDWASMTPPVAPEGAPTIDPPITPGGEATITPAPTPENPTPSPVPISEIPPSQTPIDTIVPGLPPNYDGGAIGPALPIDQTTFQPTPVDKNLISKLVPEKDPNAPNLPIPETPPEVGLGYNGYVGTIKGRVVMFNTKEEAIAAGATDIEPNYKRFTPEQPDKIGDYTKPENTGPAPAPYKPPEGIKSWITTGPSSLGGSGGSYTDYLNNNNSKLDPYKNTSMLPIYSETGNTLQQQGKLY